MLSRIFFEKLLLYSRDSLIKKLFRIPMLITVFIYIFIGYLVVEGNEYLGVILQKNFVTDVNLPGVWSIVISIISIVITFLLIVFSFSYLYSAIGSLFFEKVSSIILQKEIGGVAFVKVSTLRKINYFFQHFIFLTILTILCFFLSFIPFLNFITTGIFISYNFLNFAYSANNLSVREAINDIRRNWLTYVIIGNIFSVLLVIPIMNIFIFPMAVVFYTLMYTEFLKKV